MIVLSLAPAASAQEDEVVLPAAQEFEYDPDACPVITRQPESVTLKKEGRFTLSVEAHIPNGDAIGYVWISGDSHCGNEATAVMFSEWFEDGAQIYCYVYNIDAGTNEYGYNNYFILSAAVTLTKDWAPPVSLWERITAAWKQLKFYANNLKTAFEGLVWLAGLVAEKLPGWIQGFFEFVYKIITWQPNRNDKFIVGILLLIVTPLALPFIWLYKQIAGWFG